jgi:site-specific DNA recombinase
MYTARTDSPAVWELMVVSDELKAAGTEVIFLRGDVESNAEGRVFMHMQGAFAEYEKTKIAERTRRGKKHWAEQHALVGFREPYGYRFVKRTAEHRAHLVVDEERAAVVKNVFEWTVSKHLSQRAIAVRLTEQGVATSKGANQWQPAVIGFMLRNQIYKGVLKYNRAISDESDAGLVAGWEDPALAIVDDDTWTKAQQQLAANQRYAGRNNKRHQYLLRGLIKCPRCGGAYTPELLITAHVATAAIGTIHGCHRPVRTALPDQSRQTR